MNVKHMDNEDDEDEALMDQFECGTSEEFTDDSNQHDRENKHSSTVSSSRKQRHQQQNVAETYSDNETAPTNHTTESDLNNSSKHKIYEYYEENYEGDEPPQHLEDHDENETEADADQTSKYNENECEDKNGEDLPVASSTNSAIKSTKSNGKHAESSGSPQDDPTATYQVYKKKKASSKSSNDDGNQSYDGDVFLSGKSKA